MADRFQNCRVVITGGSSGIGLATARLLATRGAHTILLARGAELLESATEQIRAARASDDQQVNAYSVDVTQYAALVEVAREIETTLGPVDILINSAGVTRPGLLKSLDVSEYHRQMDANYFGTVHAVKAFLPGMIARRSGHIVNIASAAGFMGLYGYTAYGASKFAVRGFSDALRQELYSVNVNISIVFPTDTDTPQLVAENLEKPLVLKAGEDGLQSVMSADEVASSILRGIERKRYVITPGLTSTLFYNLAGGSLIHRFVDFVLWDAKRKIRSNPRKYKNQHKQ